MTQSSQTSNNFCLWGGMSGCCRPSWSTLPLGPFCPHHLALVIDFERRAHNAKLNEANDYFTPSATNAMAQEFCSLDLPPIYHQLQSTLRIEILGSIANEIYDHSQSHKEKPRFGNKKQG